MASSEAPTGPCPSVRAPELDAVLQTLFHKSKVEKILDKFSFFLKKAKQNETKQNRTEQNRAKQNRTEQSKTKTN